MERILIKEEAQKYIYDVSEIEHFPIYRFGDDISYIDFEKGKKIIWILMCKTNPAYRNKGFMKERISLFLKKYSDYAIEWGQFTRDGKKYIEKYTLNESLSS